MEESGRRGEEEESRRGDEEEKREQKQAQWTRNTPDRIQTKRWKRLSHPQTLPYTLSNLTDGSYL